MPTNKQRREASRRHLERQLERRQEREARQKRVTLITSIVATLVLIGVVVAVVVAVSGDDKKKNAAAPSKTTAAGATPTASATGASASPSVSHTPLPSRSAAKSAGLKDVTTSGPCGYKQVAATAKANPNLYDVGLPPDPKPTPTTSRTVVFQTNRGNVTAVLDGASAPCNVQSLTYLVQKKFFDDTACPRTVNSGIFVVQCGDPSSTTGGGPTYTVKDENLAKASYAAGAIAMANSGANTNSSQFFFITKDSNGALGKNYTVVGHVTKGLTILQKVAQSGDDGSNQAGGGRPNLDLIFKKVVLAK